MNEDLRQHQPSKDILSASEQQQFLPEGTLIAGTYKVLSALGIGGMSRVYKCQDMILNRFVAVKIMREDIGASPQAVMRFQREGQAVALLHHPNIVQVHSLQFTEAGQPFLVMEIVAGTSLADVLAKSGPVPLFRLSRIVSQICDALEEAHKHGIIHRDLKPSNIMLVNPGRADEQVKVLDFGIARILTEDSVRTTQTGEIFGSPAYMSPEQALGKSVNAMSDQYSLACVIFEMLTGRPPFTSESSLQVMMEHAQVQPPTLKKASNKDFPDYVERSLARMLAKDPESRFSSVTEARKAFLGEARFKPTKAKREFKIKQPLVVAAAIVVLLLMSVCATMIFAPKKGSSPIQAVKHAPEAVNLKNDYDKYGNDSFIQFMKTHPNIEELDMEKYFVHVNGNGLAIFEQLKPPKLRKLILKNCDDIGSEGMKYLVYLPALEELEISEMRLTDKALDYIGQIKTIRSLNISRDAWNDEAIVKLCSAPIAENLKFLDLNETGISNISVQALSNMQKLSHLEISHNNLVRDQSVPFLADLPKLSDLNMTATDVTGRTIGTLAKLKHLGHIGLRLTHVSDNLDECNKLNTHTIDLRECGITDDLIGQLAKNKAYHLLLTGNNISNEGLMKLIHAPNLEKVEARGTKVDEKGADAFIQKHHTATGIEATVETGPEKD